MKLIHPDHQFINPQKVEWVLAEDVLIKPGKYKKNRFILLLALPVLALIFYVFKFENSWMLSLQLLARSILILLLWHFIIGSFLLKTLKRFLTNKRSDYYTEAEQMLALLPALKKLVLFCREETASIKGYKRWLLFIERMIAYTLLYKPLSHTETANNEIPVIHPE